MMKQPKFLLISIQPRDLTDADHFDQLKELWQLVVSYGAEVADVVVQHREVHDKGMYIGSGKLTEIAELIKSADIHTVVLNAAVKPGQLYEIKTYLAKISPDVEVWDRVDLILAIFSQHAHTAEAKLQIELAQMRHMGPRIYGMGIEMSRQGGGIGMRGIGETNTERMKRHWSREMKKTEDQLKKLAGDRQRQLDRRRRAGLKTVSIVGYTNAGKTSLYNALVHKKKFAHDMLFATLDASVGKVFLPELKEEILISDTIGFIQGLPLELVEAFKSTLLESIQAEVLLVVIDASDERVHQKIEVVEQVLADLELSDRPRIYLFNKMDQADDLTRQNLALRYEQYRPQFISVKSATGLNKVITCIAEQLAPAVKEIKA